MAWRFRKSKTIGGLRFTLGRRGVSTSIGWGPFSSWSSKWLAEICYGSQTP
jgi:hypothetical protein